MTFFDLLTRVLLLPSMSSDVYHCMRRLVCVQIVLHHKPTELLSAQLLPNLSGWKEKYGSALVVELCNVSFGQGIATRIGGTSCIVQFLLACHPLHSHSTPKKLFLLLF